MPEVFDLSNLRYLVSKTDSDAVILVDTNVLMDYPRVKKWQNDFREPIFVVSNVVDDELGVLRHGADSKKRVKAIKAQNELEHLTRYGDARKGKQIKDVGWLIKLKPPLAPQLTKELIGLGSMSGTKSTADKILLLAYNKLAESFRNNTKVIFLTND